jgi:SAM-dependent methyltransferase
MSSRFASEPGRPPEATPNAEQLASEELALASSRRHGWYAAYIGRAYLAAVERALADADEAPIVLKADLWNERLGGARDVLGRVDLRLAARLVGVDLSLPVCAEAKSRTPSLLAVQADIRALPLRAGTIDAVVDLSVLDHVAVGAVREVIAGYRRVLRRDGVLLLVYWQLSAAVRIRLWLKRAFGRSEKQGQHYFPRDRVLESVRRNFDITHEFAAGTLLVFPLPAISVVLGCLPEAVAHRLVSRLGRLEIEGTLHRLLQHVSGLYGIVARAR